MDFRLTTTNSVTTQAPKLPSEITGKTVEEVLFFD